MICLLVFFYLKQLPRLYNLWKWKFESTSTYSTNIIHSTRKMRDTWVGGVPMHHSNRYRDWNNALGRHWFAIHWTSMMHRGSRPRSAPRCSQCDYVQHYVTGIHTRASQAYIKLYETTAIRLSMWIEYSKYSKSMMIPMIAISFYDWRWVTRDTLGQWRPDASIETICAPGQHYSLVLGGQSIIGFPIPMHQWRTNVLL